MRIDGLRKTWPDGTVTLDGLSLEVPSGEVVAILGRSGSGKSTLLRCACRLVEPTGGRVFVGGTELTGLRGRALARARARVGFVFQQFNLVRSYTALDNVLCARVAHVPWLRGTLGLWGEADRALARRCLDEVGLGEKALSPARELSGGQQQRVAIARAFAQEPGALFADEPTASLDPHLAETVMDLLRSYGRAHQVPVLVNVHTVEHARRFADRVLGLQQGRLVHDGPASALADRALETIYGPKEVR
ncbi:MAG: phosphonate ABC transporter ATP-binding protein [Deltaproteobacteria bacterium]|nr:phosphonate ABC transporter ATP-binding protein [Deltaproteobacteria bacterium]